MDAAVVSLSVGLATVLTSGVVSSVVTYRLNRNKEHTFFMRQKAEALYLAADEFGRDFSSHLLTYIPVARGDFDYNQMLDMHIANPPDKRRGGHETMAMLISIYFPEVEPQYLALLSARDQLGELRNAHKQAYKEGAGVGTGWVRAFIQVGRDTDQATKALQAAIVRSAKRYAGAPTEPQASRH